MKNKIKVLVLFGSPYLYGSEKANIDVFDSLKKKYNLDVLLLTDIKEGEKSVHPYLNKKNIKYYPTHYHYRFMKNMSIFEYFKKILKIILGSITLLKIYYKFKPTHIYLSKQEYFLNFIFVLPFLSKPVIYRIGDSPVLHNGLYRNSWKYILKKVSKFICVSKFIQSEVCNTGYNLKDTEVIYSKPHGKYFESFLNKNNKNDNIFNVLYVGQLAKHKGLDLFVESGIYLCEKFDNINFLIVGGIDEKDSFIKTQIELVKSKKLNQRIEFLDYVSDVDNIYAKADLHICPSIYNEPLANVLIDAKKHSIPSIIFSVGGLPEIIENNVNGYICEEKNKSCLSSKIEYLYLNQEECKTMGKNAFNSLYDLKVDKFEERWFNVFTSSL